MDIDHLLIGDAPLRARDGMILAIADSYQKLLAITAAASDPQMINAIAMQAGIDLIDREVLQGALNERQRRLQDQLRMQVLALATMLRQSA